MKMLTVLSVCVLASLAQSALLSDYLRYIPFKVVSSEIAGPIRVDTEWPPKFCRGLACPRYTVLEDRKGQFEVREYETSHWVSTNLANVDYTAATRTMFWKLFQYISGNNKENKTITMTAPVITRIIPGPGPACESNFTMSFYVNYTGVNPPEPSDESVFLQTLPALRAYVRSFGGYHMGSFKPWGEEAVKLTEFLEKAGDKYRYISDFYYIGGYDSPVEIFNRHNEVWFLAK